MLTVMLHESRKLPSWLLFELAKGFMKSISSYVRHFAFLLVLHCGVSTSKSGIPEFTGFMKTGEQWLVVLTDKDDGVTSGWLTSRQSFRQYKIVGLEQQNDVVVLAYGAEKVRVPLNGAKIVAARPEPNLSQLKLSLAVTGELSLEGKPISRDTLDELFGQLAGGMEGLRIVLQLSDWSKGTDISAMTQATKDILRRMKAAGFSRGEVIFGPPVRGAEPKQIPNKTPEPTP